METDVRKFLTTCAAIEKTIGEIYLQFAESIPCDKELKNIWILMAKEEDLHAMDIRLAARLSREGVFKVKDMTQRKAEELFDFTNKLLDQSRTLKISMETAVDLTIKLEEDFLTIHVASSIEFEKENMRNMFLAIVQSEEQHCRAIQGYRSKKLDH